MCNFIVNQILPIPGNCMCIKDYCTQALKLGYNRYQILGSLGGISGRSATISNGIVTRK